MIFKWLGAVLVIAACGGCGISLAVRYRQLENLFRQIRHMVEIMRSELQYRLTPLPELCEFTAEHLTGIPQEIMKCFSRELYKRISPDAGSCMQAVLSSMPQLTGSSRRVFWELGQTLGKFDMEGQLTGLEYIKNLCDLEIETLYKKRDDRMRSYHTLGFCAGIAIAVLFV